MQTSVIIRTYNSEKFIQRAVQSVLAQNAAREEFEIIVVDDGSTDKTRDILRTFGNQIRCIEEKHRGAIPAANTGLQAVRGEYVAFLDSDDEYTPMFLQKMVKAIKNGNADFAYCDYYEILKNGDKQVVSCADNLFNTLLCNIFFRKKSIIGAGPLNETVLFPEYDLLLKTLQDWKGIHVPGPLYVFYRHEESPTTSSVRTKNAIERLRVLYPDKLDVIARIRQY